MTAASAWDRRRLPRLRNREAAMHELSIALSILEFAEEEAERRGASIEAIHVQIGALSGVVKQALISAFDMAREETPLSSCRLWIEEVSIMSHCRQCNAERLIASAQS